MPFLFSILFKNQDFMYGYSSIRTPSTSSGNGTLSFQHLCNQRLNHRYQILKHLAQGGFGQTFLAVDEQNSLPCVIKQVFLQGDKTHYQTTLDRFDQEVNRK
jgi:serine/threonine protein kinase